MKKTDYDSVRARGYASKARDVGKADKVDGFGYGKNEGYHRRPCNDIVHAPLGEARNHVATAKALYEKAHVKR